MKIRVQYGGQLRTVAGCSTDEVELPNAATVVDLLAAIASRLDRAALPHLLNAAGTPQAGLLIVVNDSAIPSLDFTKPLLKAGDCVAFLPPIAGG